MEWLAPRRAAGRRLRSFGIALLSVAFVTACTRRLPRPPTPERTIPDVDVASSPPEGHGRLVVDVVQGSVPIERVRMKPKAIEGEDGRASYQLHEELEPLCDATPCAVDLRPGNLILGFPVVGDESAVQIDLVHVGEETSVYRRALAVKDARKRPGYKFGIAATTFGASAVIAGLPTLPNGLVEKKTGMAIAGGALLGVGAALVALGIHLMKTKAPSYRPGNWIHYPLTVDAETR
ncbi:MAG: hypothetical protein ACOC97_01215 [Myxococcota bacterium]